jgi:hypothetical protein
MYTTSNYQGYIITFIKLATYNRGQQLPLRYLK